MGLKKLKKFYKNKKVLITGNTGFKGMWLFLILKFLGANVRGYSSTLKKDDNFLFFKIFKSEFKKKTYFNDINNYRFLKKKLNSFKPQIIFH